MSISVETILRRTDWIKRDGGTKQEA